MKSKNKKIILIIISIIMILIVMSLAYCLKETEIYSKAGESLKNKINNIVEGESTLTIDLNGGTYKFKPNKYTVTKKIGEKEEIEVPKAPDGYQIAFNTDNGNLINPITCKKKFKNWTIIGSGKLDRNVYTFEKGDGILKANYEEVPTELPNPVKDGYTFTGWYDGENKINSPYIPSKNTTLIAHWELTVPELKINKTEFYEGEEIKIQATGSGSDWVGIYKKSENPKTIGAIRWYYVNKDGNSSGVEKDIREAIIGRKALSLIPPGEYSIYLFQGEGHNYILKKDILVKEYKRLIPISGKYEMKNTFKSSAEGKITLEANKEEIPEAYSAYWANKDGKLVEYENFIIPAGQEITNYEIPYGTILPKGTDRIYIYAMMNNIESNNYYTIQLPTNVGNYEFGQPLYEIQVISDCHIHEGKISKDNTVKALQEIKKISPNTQGVFINGDVIDYCEEKKYQLYQQIVKDSGIDPMKFYCSIGNHEYASEERDNQEKINLFLQYTNNLKSNKVYFDTWLKDNHFIFMGGETYGDGVSAYISDEQYNWLKQKLEENRKKDKPIFLFLHQGISNTVAGTFDDQGWGGVKNEYKFREILKDYPEVILFTGHSHWTMQSPHNMKARDNELPTIFNTGSTGYLWDDNGKYIYGAQGYFLYVYKDKIVLKGRDYINEKWIAKAQYLVELPKDENKDYEIIFDSNTGVGVMNNQKYQGEETKKLSKNLFTKEGYKFKEWNTKKDGTGISYKDEQEITKITTEGKLTLYAQWEKEQYLLTINPNKGTYNGKTTNTVITKYYEETEKISNPIPPKGYIISFNSNGGNQIENIETTKQFTEWKNEGLGKIEKNLYTFGAGNGILIANYKNNEVKLPTPLRNGYTFLSWRENNNKVPTNYIATKNTELKAEWVANQYEIIYDSNGGTGTMTNQVFTYDKEEKIKLNEFDKEGYIFRNWNTEKDGSGKEYENNELIKNITTEGKLTLYAQWEKISKKEITSIEIVKEANKIEYFEGERFNAEGLKIIAKYNDETSKEIKNYKIENGEKLKLGQQYVIISYQENEITKKVNHKVIVKNKENKIEELLIIQRPEKDKYIVNKENLDLSKGKLKAIYTDKTEEIIDMTDKNLEVTGYDNKKLGIQYIKLKYKNKIVELEIEIINEEKPETKPEEKLENSDLSKIINKEQKIIEYNFKETEQEDYFILEIEMEGIIKNVNHDKLEYYYYISKNKKENNIKNWKKIDNQNNNDILKIEIDSRENKKLLELMNEKEIYIYIKEIAYRGNNKKSETISKGIRIDLKNREKYVDGIKEENSNNQDYNQNIEEDTTISKNDKLPFAGNDKKIIILIILISITTLIFYLKKSMKI